MCQVHGVLVGVSVRQSGELSLQVYNSTEEAKMLSQKVSLVVVFAFLDTIVEWDKTMIEEMRMHVGSISFNGWLGKFLVHFEKAWTEEFLKKTKSVS